MAVLAVGGCQDESGSGSAGDDVDVRHDEQLSAQLRELSSERRTATLSDLTGWAWDTVHVFGEGQSAGVVQDVVGSPVLDQDFFSDAGNLLVFETDGEVVEAVSAIPGGLHTAGSSTFNRDVRLVPCGQGTPALLCTRTS